MPLTVYFRTKEFDEVVWIRRLNLISDNCQISKTVHMLMTVLVSMLKTATSFLFPLVELVRSEYQNWHPDLLV